jgi:hypothetical protein
MNNSTCDNDTVNFLVDPLDHSFCEIDRWFLIIQSIYLSIASILGIAGNVFILLLVLRYKFLRYQSMIVSLSIVISDLMIVFFVHLPGVISVSNGGWALGYEGCQAFGFIGFYFIYVRWLSMTVVCLDRFSFIIYPIHYAKCGKPYIITLTAAAWTAPLLMTIPSVTGDIGMYTFRPNIFQCSIHCDDNMLCFGIYIALYSLEMIFGVIIPSILYTIMYAISRHKRKQIQLGSHSNRTERPTQQWSKNDSRILTVYMLILMVLVITNIPIFIMQTMRRTEVYEKTPIWIHMLFADVFYATNFLNPLIIIRNRDIYKAIKSIFKTKRRMSIASYNSSRRSSTVSRIQISDVSV